MKRKQLPPRRDSRITSQYIPSTGEMLIGVARGFAGGGEVLYRIDAEKMAGAIEDRKELAVIVNNLGLLVLAQLCGFNLAENLDELPKALARWAHIDIEALKKDDAQEALAIAQRNIHGGHGLPSDTECECTGTEVQTICARIGCALCKETNEGTSAFDGIDRVVLAGADDGGRDSAIHGDTDGDGADLAAPVL